MSDRVSVDPVIVTCAVRYALGRRSYMPGLMRDALIDAWGDLGDQRANIVEMIERHLDESDPGEWVYNEPWVEFLRTRSEGGRVTGRPVVYVAGPYSQGDPAENVATAVRVASLLMDRGWAWPLVPHLSHLWHMIAPRPHRDWIDLDLALLARCDGLVRLPGASAGADGEVDWAVEHGVPVHRLPLAWSSTTALARLRSWLDGLAVGTEVER